MQGMSGFGSSLQEEGGKDYGRVRSLNILKKTQDTHYICV